MPMKGRGNQRLKINITSRFNQLLSDGGIPILCRHVERCGTILGLKINVTSRFNQLLRDGRMSILGRGGEWRSPIVGLKIGVTTCINELSVLAACPFCAVM